MNTQLVGEELDIVVTGWGKQPGSQMGRTTCHRIVHFQAQPEPVPLGSVTRSQVTAALSHSLLAERVAAR